MERVFLVVGALMIAGTVAAILSRHTDPPAANTHHVPSQLDRSDFDATHVPWLVAVFTSAKCETCQGVWDLALQLESEFVAVQEIEATRNKQLHERYRIDGVPTLVIADSSGSVKRAFLGPMTSNDLLSALRELGGTGNDSEGHTV